MSTNDDAIRRSLREFKEATSEALARHDDRFDAVEGRLEAVEGRLEAVEGRLEAVEVRMGRVEHGLTGVERGLRELGETLSSRITIMETAIMNSIAEFSSSVDRRLTRVEERLDGAA